ncbi:apolipoprotein N-acyltransferase [Alteraurantiacibacter aquimixticola]|uniref:Apolipoprotein N-acyltransferase n=1 Tax=Alteraurantiacibacter aquimixticola TaxID=2489173 RepID=A0A4T3F403_9SPHN|nr:apolipoprotein N-acyltransferase [Alteraurantiacibacter aquimixticola]TIX49433.1 apolipoprotein N-acyltransferase [Alteraurantiacibacter aquimixticola]
MTRFAGIFSAIAEGRLPARAGWLAVLLGVLSATGFQPLALWPLGLLATGLFAAMIPATSGWRQAAWLGWLFGMGHFTFGNNWIAVAFTYQANMPAVLGWPAVPLLSIPLSAFPALAALGTRLIAKQHAGGMAFALAFAGCWIIAEWLRSWVLTGFAWNPLGIMLLGPMDRPGLAALAPVLGTYALSGLAALLAAGLAWLLLARRWLPSVLAVLLLALGIYWPAGEGEEGTLPVTIAQPDIRQEWLHDPRQYENSFLRLAQLSLPRGEPGEHRLVLWPESGLADYLESGYPQRYYTRTTALGSPEYARMRIARTLGEGSMLLTGGQRLELAEGRLVGAWNSVTALDDRGGIAGVYSKAHLVPFGEYLPLRPLLEPIGLSRLVPGSIDFLTGPGPATLDLGPHGRAGVQICYEIVFSGQVVDRDDRPDFIFNPTNDGWFGAFGPPQHFAQARLRAIEEGLPVLRATTTGISGVIDARGVVRAMLPSHHAGRIDVMLPPAAEPTLFARLGNLLPLAWAFLLLLLASVAMHRTQR